ncbi:MAG: hypothetical protein DWQ34_16695 [Planctomycetota bacterium]|nr:MAG: hypothetical protein DWQ34_16695 [Planctomycetota bacterium]REK26715.1 MAG: hypothetical protein DWQ41_09225 [Planctomycetota bacterium]REK35624.1 MAG: hypothetical protein DWQ45_10730 [Planctomycetota bacterium]
MSEREKSGMATSTKVILAVVGIGGVALLVCCGVAIWFFSQSFDVIENPDDVQAMADSIATIEIPAPYQPYRGMKFDLGVSMQMALFSRNGGNQQGAVVLMQMAAPGQQNDEQMKAQFRQQMQQSGQNQEINVESSETRTFVIDGEECDFEFVSGTDQSGNQVRQVTGVFPGRGGAAFLMVLEQEDNWDEDAVVQMIESITAE